MKLEDVLGLLERIEYRDWSWRVGPAGPNLAIWVAFQAPDPETGHVTEQLGRPWLITPEMDASAIVRTAFLAVLTAEEHEIRENFRFCGEPVFGPHGKVPGT